MNKFLNMKPTYDKDKVKAVVKEVLSDVKPPTPQPQPRPQPRYHTPMKIPPILGTFLSPPPPPPVKPQTPYDTDDSDNEDDDDDKPLPRAAALKATQQLQDMSKKKGGAWISKN